MDDFIQEKPIGESVRAPIGFSDSANGLYIGEKSAQAPGEKLVVFFLSGNLYGISAQRVAEISQPVPIAVLPNAPEWLLGIGNLRGEIIAVANLPFILGENAAIEAAKTKLIVLKTKNFDTAIAFPVDKLSEIITSNEKNKKAAEAGDSPYIYANFTYQSNIIRLIDAERLLLSLA